MILDKNTYLDPPVIGRWSFRFLFLMSFTVKPETDGP